MKTNRAFDAIVVGGGAAGMMAALTAAGEGARVLLLEKNRECGRKLLITGKGRCNLTNDSSVEEVMGNIPTNARFLYSCITRFPPSRTMEFFRSLGVELKVERGNRVFPVSDKAGDVTAALCRAVARSGARVEHLTVTKLLLDGGAVRGVLTDGGEYTSGRVLVATGGLSYPRTGSTGDGYAFARQAGHTVTRRRGSLVPLTCEGPECAMMQGLSLRNVAIDLRTPEGKSLYRDFGEMLFTHFGVSGPIILSASAHIRQEQSFPLELIIDLKPALDENKLDGRIRTE